ncbi:MAG TPA: DUF1015 domain-containing protein [Bacillota bacterium]|nr:DUF1015 domain-containing protein [Bacillota bacterium]
MSFPVYHHLAIAAPEILLPNKQIDLEKWAVIACDQFTSEPKYWEQVEEVVGDAPSTLRMFLPEVYLESLSVDEIDAKFRSISVSITDYLHQGILEKKDPGFIFLDRKTKFMPSRKGMMLAIDLEQYDFTPGNKSRIRATEGTVLSRIPPRVRIRANAPIELPHIMLLIDDPNRTVIEPAFATLSAREQPCYDTDLMMEGGHITGYYADSASDVASNVISALDALVSASDDGFLFAVGDGNHSVASAKAHWDNIKASLDTDEREIHPARFALVEVVNIHDEGLAFEPIHRVAFGLDFNHFSSAALEYFKDQGVSILRKSEFDALSKKPLGHVIGVTNGKEDYFLCLSAPNHSLAVGVLQPFLDGLESDAITTDYIHGEDSVRSLANEKALGFLLPSISKSSFFPTIATEGIFPRKTFSMGEAVEKRYYLESKMI